MDPRRLFIDAKTKFRSSPLRTRRRLLLCIGFAVVTLFYLLAPTSSGTPTINASISGGEASGVRGVLYQGRHADALKSLNGHSANFSRELEQSVELLQSRVVEHRQISGDTEETNLQRSTANVVGVKGGSMKYARAQATKVTLKMTVFLYDVSVELLLDNFKVSVVASAIRSFFASIPSATRTETASNETIAPNVTEHVVELVIVLPRLVSKRLEVAEDDAVIHLVNMSILGPAAKLHSAAVGAVGEGLHGIADGDAGNENIKYTVTVHRSPLFSELETVNGRFLLRAVHDYLSHNLNRSDTSATNNQNASLQLPPQELAPHDSATTEEEVILVLDLSRATFCRLPQVIRDILNYTSIHGADGTMRGGEEHAASPIGRAKKSMSPFLLYLPMSKINPYNYSVRAEDYDADVNAKVEVTDRHFLRALYQSHMLPPTANMSLMFNSSLDQFEGYDMTRKWKRTPLREDPDVRVVGAHALIGDEVSIRTILGTMVASPLFESSRLGLPMEPLLTQAFWDYVFYMKTAHRGKGLRLRVEPIEYNPMHSCKLRRVKRHILLTQREPEECVEINNKMTTPASMLLNVRQSCFRAPPEEVAMGSDEPATRVCGSRFRLKSDGADNQQVDFVLLRSPPEDALTGIMQQLKRRRPNIVSAWDRYRDRHSRAQAPPSTGTLPGASSKSAPKPLLPSLQFVCPSAAQNGNVIETAVLSHSAAFDPNMAAPLILSFLAHHRGKCNTVLILLVTNASKYLDVFPFLKDDANHIVILVDVEVALKTFWDDFAANRQHKATGLKGSSPKLRQCLEPTKRHAYFEAVLKHMRKSSGEPGSWQPDFVLHVDARDAIFQMDISDAIREQQLSHLAQHTTLHSEGNGKAAEIAVIAHLNTTDVSSSQGVHSDAGKTGNESTVLDSKNETLLVSNTSTQVNSSVKVATNASEALRLTDDDPLRNSRDTPSHSVGAVNASEGEAQDSRRRLVSTVTSFLMFPPDRWLLPNFDILSGASSAFLLNNVWMNTVYSEEVTQLTHSLVVQQSESTGAELPMPIICSGLFFGTFDAMVDTFELFTDTMEAWGMCAEHPEEVGLDQGVMIGLVAFGFAYVNSPHAVYLLDPWYSKFTQLVSPNDIVWKWISPSKAKALNSSVAEPPLLGIVNCRKEPFAVVHQLDRYVEQYNMLLVLNNFTLDTPVPYRG